MLDPVGLYQTATGTDSRPAYSTPAALHRLSASFAQMWARV